MDKIIIEKPYIEKNRLCCDIKTKDVYNMWFEVEEKYVKYLCSERADAFLVAILPYAIKHELNIESKEKISSKLYYQLNKCLLPTICKEFHKKLIQINANIDNNNLKNENAVGTGISLGVDSFYTILTNMNLKTSEFNITHLTFFNAGASGKFGGDEARTLYNFRKERSRKFAKENGLGFVCVDSNMNEFLMMSHLATHTYRSMACTLALQKLFSKYYYASIGEEFNVTSIKEDPGYYDVLLLQCLSTENLQLYSDGIGVTRIEKVKEIVKYPITYRWLNVCINGEENCGHCQKCVRTLLELDSIGKVENYKDVFNIKEFQKNRVKFLANMLAKKGQDYFLNEVFKEYTKNNVKIPTISYLIAIKIKFENGIKKIIKIILPKSVIRKIKEKRGNEIIDESW